MTTFFLTIHMLLALCLVFIILFQKTETGGLGSGSGPSLFSVRGKTNFLTRATAIIAGLFMANCLILAILYRTPTTSIIVGEDALKKAPAIPMNEVKESQNPVGDTGLSEKKPLPALAPQSDKQK